MKIKERHQINADAGKNMTMADFLAQKYALPKMEIKRAMEFGSVTVLRRGNKKRVRRSSYELWAGDVVDFCYDSELILKSKNLLRSIELEDFKDWGVWYKPPGRLSQGNEFGDGSSILREVEKAKGEAYLIHRLDREASGLMVFAYSERKASQLSKIWQEHKIKKIYKARVLRIAEENSGQDWKEIDLPLDGKPAVTKYRIISSDQRSTLIDVEILTGRLHQIRRHMEFVGHPVIGDPKYGKGNKDRTGLKLIATSLEFTPPGSKSVKNFELPTEYIKF